MNLRKIWRFIWNDDSLLSWLVNIVIAIILVKFVIYPVLGLLLGTGYPVVAVVSCSMEHGESNCWADCYMKGASLNYCLNKEGTICGRKGEFWDACGSWYEDHEIDEGLFKGFQQSNGFNIGDIFVLRKAENIELGDVIIYNNKINNAPIIHRVVKVEGDVFQTKGDHNKGMMEFEEKVEKEQIYGKVLFKIPYLGWVKIFFNMLTGRVF